jgi:phosphate transport system substrate-binding protein
MTQRLLPLIQAAALASLGALYGAAQPLTINGSTTVNLPVVEAAEVMRAERGLRTHVDTQGGSSGGIAALADGRADIGMSSKALSESDRRKFPGVPFEAIRIGQDAVALIVSRYVWQGGVRALSADQVRDILEGRIVNWREVGGPDRRIVFINKEPGRGTWEVFVQWLYGIHELAHLISRHHDERFVATLDKHLPQWRAHRTVLNAAPLSHSDWIY